ncbi:GNAT family N-acetyltransferase [Mariniflexile ostreae]|uniref:GNAT family N-acetyltransferase n=1 Tax=Mariniflexile ostreae TaxID=1520892 RepID=A0ABV5FCH7_9FLAO
MKTYCIYKSYKALPKSWDALVAHDLFLQSDYLQALEEASPQTIQLFYIGVFSSQKLVGVAVVQRVQLYLKDMFRTRHGACLKTFFQDSISKVLKGNILVVGNLTHTGQHSLFFQNDNITQSEYLKLIYKALSDIKKDIKLKQNKTIRAIMFKDYFIEDSLNLEYEFFNSRCLRKVLVQPNMMLSLRPDWLKKEDYKTSLNKKYRDRYKRARKKRNGIVCKELDLESIKNTSKKLHALYLNVSHNASFNTFFLPQHHFYTLKQQLKVRFRVFGYYLDDDLIGFYSLILNGNHLETYFLGYNSKHQLPNQIYLNMLYDMAEFAIEHQFEKVVYARTAMEIKSSVGAKPKAMLMYIKHTNRFVNALLKPIFYVMNPSQDWVERHPFTN